MERSDYVSKINKHIGDKKLSKKVEKNIHDFSHEYCVAHDMDEDDAVSIYVDKMRDILHNLETNNTLVEKIKAGEVSDIAYAKPCELNPEKWNEIKIKREYYDTKIRNITTTDRYECNKCHKRKCTALLKQTRSADEPMTLIITCTNCDNVMRFY
jgi:transcription elongation factor S-II